MKEIKMEKDIVLVDSYYYFNKLYDEIETERTLAKENNDKEKIYRYAYAMILLAGITKELTENIFMFKHIDKNYDINTEIKEYNDNCNLIIRLIINNERI